ncbi:MAG: acyl-CoA dehydrogenase family protein [Deltaproteobacteria bacterium]|nr:acyl-CoA dehydrogenase family protein [Deltaproteobacteria bacterium]
MIADVLGDRPGRADDDPARVFADELSRFLAERVDPARVDADHRLPEGLLGELAELGVFGVSIPERWGGSELGLGGACTLVEALAHRDRAVATTVGLHVGLGTRGLVAFATDAQRDRWLPDLASGRRLAAFATTEPGAGSDLSRLATRARLDPATGRLRVDGQKIYVTNGGLARTYTIAVATEGLGGAAFGQNLLVLERDDGVVVGAEERKLGLRGSSTTSLFLDGVDVGVDRVIGAPGSGHKVIGQVLAFGRTAMAAGCTGTAWAALEGATRHVAERRQFGKPLAAQPVVRVQLADMVGGLLAMRAIVAATGRVEHDEAELERRSLAAKVFCSEMDWTICDTALQLHGGSGYVEETGAALLLRDARITRIFEGANDVLLSRLGALEMVRPSAPAATGTAADDVAALLVEVRAAWGGAADGLKVLRDPVRLHRLGRLAVLREVAVATAEHAAPGQAAQRDHALARLRQAAEAAARVPTPTDHVDDVVDALLNAVSP